MDRDSKTKVQRLATVLDELLCVPLRDVKPTPAFGPLWSALEPVGPLSILSVGRTLDLAVTEKLHADGCEVVDAGTLTDALSSMEQQFFDAVLRLPLRLDLALDVCAERTEAVLVAVFVHRKECLEMVDEQAIQRRVPGIARTVGGLYRADRHQGAAGHTRQAVGQPGQEDGKIGDH